MILVFSHYSKMVIPGYLVKAYSRLNCSANPADVVDGRSSITRLKSCRVSAQRL